MKLADYINTFVKGPSRMDEKARLCAALGITEAALRHWVSGIRNIDPSRVLRVEALTGGKVKRSDMRPDIYPPRKKRATKIGKGLQKAKEGLTNE